MVLKDLIGGELRKSLEGIWAENVYKFKFFLKKNFKITKQELDEVAVRLRDSHAYLNKHAHLWQTHESVDDDEFYKQIILLLKIYQSLDLRDRSKIGLNKNLKSLANEGNNE